MEYEDYEVVLENGILRAIPDPGYHTPKGLGHHIFKTCDKYKNELFQICPYTKKPMTFDEYKIQSANLAANLRHLCSIQAGDIVMICMKASLENALPLTSTIYLNAITCSTDVAFTVDDFQHFIGLVQPKVIFVDTEVVQSIKKAQDIAKNSAMLIVNQDSPDYISGYHSLQDLIVPSEMTKGFQPVIVDNGNTISAIVFSSGTTGMPKAICLSQDGLTSMGCHCFNLLGRVKVMLYTGSFYWVSSLGIFFSQFIIGTTKVPVRKFDIDLLCQASKEFNVESTFIPTGLLPNILAKKDTIRNIPSLKTIGVGGMLSTKGLLNKLRDTFPNIRFSHGYGLTETSGPCIGFVGRRMKYSRQIPESCGTPFAGLELKVIDRDTGKTLGPNEEGEICLRSAYLALGFYKNPSLSIAAEDGFVRTGDLGHYDDNKFVYITGRCKEVFKYLGWQIVPVVLENIINEHSAVKESVVFGIPNVGGGCLPTAAVILKEGYDNTSLEEIEKFVEERVYDANRLRGGVFILKELPRTPSGKIQHRKLFELIKTE